MKYAQKMLYEANILPISGIEMKKFKEASTTPQEVKRDPDFIYMDDVKTLT